jgi:hypothetical protein
VSDYPACICSRCGSKHGKHSRPWSTWHADTCGWCGKYTSCTEPRDFGYPPEPANNPCRLRDDPVADLAFDLVPGPAADAVIELLARNAKDRRPTTPHQES